VGSADGAARPGMAVGVADAAAGIGAAAIRGAISTLRAVAFCTSLSLDFALLGETAQTSFASMMAAATGSVAELVRRKAPLPAAATITPAAMQKRTSGEGLRAGARRDNTGVGSRAASAGSRGGCSSAISARARAGLPCITGTIARSDRGIILGAATEWMPASSL